MQPKDNATPVVAAPWQPPIPTLPASREGARQLVETLIWPDAPTLAHANEWHASTFGPTTWRAPRGRYDNAGRDGYSDDCPSGPYDETFRTCSYCGSIHPQDLARILLGAPTEYPPLPPDPMTALEQWVTQYQAEHDGAEPPSDEVQREHQRAYRAYYDAKSARVALGGADWKYGWPHKFYVEGISNPAAGLAACTGSESGPVYEDDGVTIKRDEHGEVIRYLKPHISPAPATMHAKWYNAHFADLEGATFDFMAALIYERTRILFYRRPEESNPLAIFYAAPYRGYQA